MITEIINNPFFNIVSALFGFLLGHRLALGRDRLKRFDDAAAIFRDAFLSERRRLDIRHTSKEDGEKSAYDILEPAFKKHTAAMLRFRDYLPKWKQYLFDRAWNEYSHYEVEGDLDTPFPEMYYESKWEGQDTKELAARRIDNLLKFARPK